MPVQMKTVSDLSQYGEEGSILRLKGLLTVRGDHYTSLSEPPAAEATNSQWLHFNPQAAEKGKICCSVYFNRNISFFMQSGFSAFTMAGWRALKNTAELFFHQVLTKSTIFGNS